MKTIRVAALQFAVDIDVAENLQTCLQMLDRAADIQADLIVMPEFCNHSSWYRDQDHAYEVAVSLDGEFTRAIGSKAKELGSYIMLNCTVRREQRIVTGTNILFDPNGTQIATSDKQVLMGNENNFLSKAQGNCPIVETHLGRIGMYSCMDGVIFETPRGLAVRGAQVLLNSLNSFADDEASLHVPVRAAENKVFVVAANKVGSLVPEELAAVIAERVQITPEHLHGAGESQIVAPNGTVLAKAPRTGDAIIYADIHLEQANNKLRPDGTNIITSRRPVLYQPLAQAPQQRLSFNGVQTTQVAIYQPPADGEQAITEIMRKLPTLQDSTVLVLPELFHIPDRQVDDVVEAVKNSQVMLGRFQQRLNEIDSNLLVCTSIVNETPEGYAHAGVLLSREGVLLEQNQLHRANHYAKWQTSLGNNIQILDTTFGRTAIVVGNDSIYPEVFRLLALQDVEIALVPMHILESWEVETGLRERAAENRINIVAASRNTPHGGGIILGIDEDFTLWTPWKKRPFDGNINYPIVTQITSDGFHTATIYPASSANRLVSQQTDVVDSRPYWLLDPLVT